MIYRQTNFGDSNSTITALPYGVVSQEEPSLSTTYDIEIQGQHASIKAARWEAVPSLVVLTGENGAGKSQLLRVIAESFGIDARPNLHVRSTEHRVPLEASAKISGMKMQIGDVFHSDAALYLQIRDHASEQEFHEGVMRAYEMVRKNSTHPPLSRPPYFDDLALSLSDEQLGGKITADDLYSLVTPAMIAGQLLHTTNCNLALLFLSYALLKAYVVEKGETEQSVLKRFGEPPWETLNAIFAAAGLNYVVSEPPVLRAKIFNNAPHTYRLALLDVVRGTAVAPKDLSSGEKVLISTLVWRYSAESINQHYKLLLLDEPDAHLHPALLKRFMNVITEVFVRQRGVKVIMTTHSPTTVAIAPNDSLFRLDRTSGGHPHKVDKDDALRLLTSELPALSVLYENRRQVFVESFNDVAFFESIYRKLFRNLKSEISLDFIASGNDKTGTGCERVSFIVETLAKLGNKFVYGIVDWDRENKPSAQLAVLGEGTRYSIENYLFDPLLLAIFLLRDLHIDKATLQMHDNEKYSDIAGFPEERLGAICSVISAKLLYAVFNSRPSES